MNGLSTLWNSLQESLGVHIPQLLGALLIFVVGWFVAALVKAGVRKGLGALGLNKRISGTTGKPVDIEGVVALVLFWVVILLTLSAVFNALDLALVVCGAVDAAVRLRAAPAGRAAAGAAGLAGGHAGTRRDAKAARQDHAR